MATINVDVGAKIVVLDQVARWCMTLAPPDPWAQFYHWAPLQKGLIQPYAQAGREPEYFEDEARMQFAVDAWTEAAPPPEPEPEEPA